MKKALENEKRTSVRRVAITGLGVLCAIGGNVKEYWESLIGGRSGIEELTLFSTEGYRTHLAAQINDPWVERYPIKGVKTRYSRCDILGLIATEEAVRDAGILESDESFREGIGVIFGAGAGGMLSAENYRKTQILESGKKANPNNLLPFPSGAATDLIACKYGFSGPRTTVVTACSSSASAVGMARDAIVAGEADIMISGGSDALSRLTFAGFNSLRSVDEKPCRPFDAERKGLSIGEGAGILVLEELEHARARNAGIYAEILGYGLSCDAHHMTAPDPGGKGAAEAMKRALHNSGIAPEEIDYVSAHGTATPANDPAETRALKSVFGRHAYRLSVSSIKSMIGHCLGSAGALESVALALTILYDVIPPTLRLTNPDPQCDLDYTPNEARRKMVNKAMTNSFAFGGNNTSIIFSKCEES